MLYHLLNEYELYQPYLKLIRFKLNQLNLNLFYFCNSIQYLNSNYYQFVFEFIILIMSVLTIINQLNFYYKNLWESDLFNFVINYLIRQQKFNRP